MAEFTIKKNNAAVLEVAVKDADDALVTNLAEATNVKFQVKEKKSDAVPKIAKTKGSGIEVNQPDTGYMEITLTPTDNNLTVGTYYMAVQIEWSPTEIYEIDLAIDGVGIDTLRIEQEIIS